MRDLFEEIREKYKSVKLEILVMCVIVLAMLWLNGRELAQEASVSYDGSGTATMAADDMETESETERETEASSELPDEALTPAELAMLEENEEEPDNNGRTADSVSGETGVLPGMRLWRPFAADFRIPMAMPVVTKLWAAEPVQGGEAAKHRIVEYQDGYKIVGYGAYRPFSLLKKMVENRVAKYEGDWSVYVKNLKTDESFVVNDRPMKSASVMKLFIMGTVYKAVEAGELERTDEVVSLLNNMITVSDNEASNRLLYLLGNSSYADGIAKVDAFIREYGFSDMTIEYNGFNSSETVMDPGHNNQVSAKDCGKLLEDIYRRTWLNRSAANEIEQMMLNQQTRYKIPAGLPEGVSCGNKTGEMDTTENDAAVVYAQDCDYILVVLSSDWDSKDQAISRIASMSEMVYTFLN